LVRINWIDIWWKLYVLQYWVLILLPLWELMVKKRLDPYLLWYYRRMMRSLYSSIIVSKFTLFLIQQVNNSRCYCFGNRMTHIHGVIATTNFKKKSEKRNWWFMSYCLWFWSCQNLSAIDRMDYFKNLKDKTLSNSVNLKVMKLVTILFFLMAFG
jgi:hypothetical protein